MKKKYDRDFKAVDLNQVQDLIKNCGCQIRGEIHDAVLGIKCFKHPALA